MNSRKQGNGPSPTPRGAAQRSSGAKGGDIFRRVASLVKDFTVLLSVVGGSLLIHEFLRRFMPAPSDYEQFTGGFSTQGDPSVQKQTDPYAVLKIADGSDLEVAKKSYRKLALIYHPDRQSGKDAAERAQAEAVMKDINTAYREIQLRHGVADETATDKEPAPTASDSHEDTCGSTGGGPDVAQADTQREINRVAREEMQRLDAELELMRQRLRRESVGQRAKMSVKKKDKPAQRHAERPRKGSGSAASATSCADSVSYDAKKLPTAPDIVKPVEPEPNSTANSPQSGPTSPVQIAVFELSMHPLAVAVRMNLIYAFHSLLETQIHSFDSCEQVSIHDKLDAEGNNVLHYCVYFGRLEITSYVLAVAGINWTDLVFDLNKVGLKPSEIVGKSYNNQEYGDFKEGGNTSKCHKSTEHEQVVEKLKHFEANHRSVFDLEHRKFDWMMVLAFIVEVFGVLKILHIEAAVSGVHLLGRYETILAVALRMAPVINASSLHIVAAITFMVTAALRILLHSSWLKLSFGGITLIFSVLGIKCCCPGVLGLLLAVALIVNHLVLLLFRILSIPSAIFGHLFQILVMPNIDTFLKEVDDAKEKKRMLFLLWKLQSIVMYCILWFVINICCVVLNKLFVTTGVNETNDSDVNTGVSFD